MKYIKSNPIMLGMVFLASARRIAIVLSGGCLLLAGSLYGVGTGTLDRVSGWYPMGTNLTVIATPGLYSQFDGWQGDTNGTMMVDTQITFTVAETRSIEAVFRRAVTSIGAVPYEWLVTWTNDFETAVTNDWDGDGFTTEQEYWCGTDPDNPDSYLRISGLVRAGGVLRFAWSHSDVDSVIPPIRIERSTNLLHGVWEYIGDVQPTNGVNTFESPAGVHGFYRLCVPDIP